METMPGYTQSSPLNDRARQRRNRFWTGLIIGVPLFCLVMFLAAGVYFYGPEIPYLSSLFASPTPSALVYENPAAGIRLKYPLTWQVSETGSSAFGYTITFASSAEILASPAKASESGAVLMVGTINLPDLPFTIDAEKMGDAINLLASLVLSDMQPNGNLHIFKMSGFPAASGTFIVNTIVDRPTSVYLTAALREDAVVLFTAFCPQSEWNLQQPVFDKILDSVTLFTP
jgi:hypothetical protein